MTRREEQTLTFLREKLQENPAFQEDPAAGAYRLEHSLRVARIGGEIAEREGFDRENTVLACLLHDISYCEKFETREDWLNHGRRSASIARNFLLELGVEPKTVEEMCYAIAIHVDDHADFPGERTAFALTVGDADNIDRFDVYRLYETLETVKFSGMTLREKAAHVEKTLGMLEEYLALPFGTQTATAMWRERIEYYRGFYSRLARQIAASTPPTDADGAPAGEESGTHDRMMGISGRF